MFPEQDLESADDDSWQVSYLDIITIILGFLIILLSVSSFKDIETFSVTDLFKSSENETEFITTPVEQIKERLEALLAQEIAAGQLEIYRELNDVKIRFRSDDIYRSGSAEIQPDSRELLNRVLAAFELIEYNDFEIDVEGHTDNVPITTASYPSNWELSTARASNVVKYFSQMGINEDRLKASGYASSRPVIEFDDQGNPVAASRSKNRRVVLRLFYSTPEQMVADNSTEESSEQDQEVVTNEDETVPENTEVVEENIAEAENKDSNTDEENNTKITEPEEKEQITETVSPPVSNQQKQTTRTQENTVSKSPLKDSDGCSYAVQVGTFESFANSIRAANEAESSLGVDQKIIYNNFLFSVRGNSVGSLSEAINRQRNLKSSSSEPETSAIISQCYNQDYQYPESLTYIIQLGFFQNEQNAANFKETLSEEYGIESQIENLSLQAHTVFAGPFTDRKFAQQKINEFRQNEILSNVFLKYDSKTVSDYSYDYQILAGSYRSKTKAFQISQSLQDEFGINSEVITKQDGNSYVITQVQNNWDDALIRFEELTRTSLDLAPVIYLSEKS